MPSAHSPSRTANTDRSQSRPGRRETWPTAGTLLFTGADLEEAVAAAVAEVGDDVEVQAARSVKQGLRGKTHVEVLVTRPEDVAVRVVTPPPLPPSEQAGPSVRRRGRSDEDPVESTLAALLASAEAEEDEYGRARAAERAGVEEETSVVPFEPPQLAGNPTFAAEFAAAFPAALAKAKQADGQKRGPRVDRSARVARRLDRPVEDEFTVRVREALRRVPEESDADLGPDCADTDELEVVRPARTVAAVRTGLEAHPALEVMDEPTASSTALSTAGPTALPTALPPGMPTAPVPAAMVSPSAPPAVPDAPDGRIRRGRPTPGPLGLPGRPAALHRTSAGGWSVERLHELGVPARVLDALPAEEPTDDLRWLVALTDAIAATVPAPAADGTADVTASGTGLRGALALLRLGVEGVPPLTLTVDGRALPATATELALAIRAGILR